MQGQTALAYITVFSQNLSGGIESNLSLDARLPGRDSNPAIVNTKQKF